MKKEAAPSSLPEGRGVRRGLMNLRILCRRSRGASLVKDSGAPNTLELWQLRLLADAGLWQELDPDELSLGGDWSGEGWVRELFDELNWAMAVSLNADFLETGCVSRLLDKFMKGTLVSGGKNDDAATSGIVAREDRLQFLRTRLSGILETATSLLNPSTDRGLPEELGAYWRCICGGGTVRKWLGIDSPESIKGAYEKLRARIDDETACLPQPLAENLADIRRAFGLSDLDTRILAFLLEASIRGSGLGLLLEGLNFSHGAQEVLVGITAAALGEDRQAVMERLGREAPLIRTGLVGFSESLENDFWSRLEFLDHDRFRCLTSMRIPLEKLLSSTVSKAPEPELTLADYTHLPVASRVLTPFLRKAIKERRAGVNILLYGMPGTGKTQLSRAVCRELGAELYDVATAGESGRQASRLQRWETASIFLSAASDTVLAVDEAEDIFNDDGASAPLVRISGELGVRINKGRINRLLETNPLPTFWITNSIRSIDPAMIRRFDLVIEVPAPGLEGRRRIIEQAFGGGISESTASRLAQAEKLAPAVVRRTARVASMVGFGDGAISEEDVVGLFDETLRAQDFGSVPGTAAALPPFYDARLVNADVDLKQLALGLKEAGAGRLCLYGPPGTGKSAYAAWLAEAIGRPLMRRTAAQLMSCYVGMTEKLIAEAFRTAQRANAVLLIDEADTFLLDRTRGQHSWETSQVNEMLAQMERCGGYFIATTNLLETCDSASMRRFDLKARFDYLKPEQAVALAQRQLAELGIRLEAADGARISGWSMLTPGDFAAVRRQGRFRPYRTSAEFVSRLAEELALKKGGSASRIGFY